MSSFLPSPDSRPPTPEHQNEVLVRVSGVSKKFCRDLKKSLWYGVKDVARELLPFRRRETGNGKQKTEDGIHPPPDPSLPFPEPGLRPGEFWANKDISFELRRGECIGLIGRNGAGKTTLLKMLNGLIKPDQGTIEMRGRVGALIALGAGFNPILTGRENIYVNGSVLGLSKEEIDAKIDDIIDFAEIRDFIDAPVQSYSSGMQVRLGFAVATALNPDVLILDEVLAVGDAAFRSKCYQRIAQLRSKAAVIFVSHNMDQVGRICSKCLVLSKGQPVFLGPTDEAINIYDNLNKFTTQDATFIELDDGIDKYECEAQSDNGSLHLKLNVRSAKDYGRVKLRIVFFLENGMRIATADADSLDFGITLSKGENKWSATIPDVPLKNGEYAISVVIDAQDGSPIVWDYKNQTFSIRHKKPSRSDCQINLDYSLWKAFE